LLKWLDRKDERNHELSMFRLQTDLEKQRGTFTLEEKYVDHSTAALDAIQEAFKEQSATASASYKWVAAASALVRPGITYVLFGLYCAVKVTAIVYSISSGAPWREVLGANWTTDDFALLNLVITFWFVGRAIEKYQK
jgi:hypothetical protein